MMNFKNQTVNNPGFSFVEVVMAMAIMAIILTSLFGLQNTAFNSALREHALISRIYYIKNLFFDTVPNKIIKKSLPDPETKLEIITMPAKSPEIVKRFENMYIVNANGQWKIQNKNYQEVLTMLLYLPPAPKKPKPDVKVKK